MKKYVVTTLTAVILLFGSQLIPMDKGPSVEEINAFKRFLTSKLQSEQESYLFGDLQFPMFDTNPLIQWKQHILDMLQKHRLNRTIAQEIFLNMVKEIIIQEIASRNPDVDIATIELWYNQRYRLYLLHAANLIFS
jgi:hypothetical protein